MHFEVQWHPTLHMHVWYQEYPPPPPERSAPKIDSKIAALVNMPSLISYGIDQLSSSLDYTC